MRADRIFGRVWRLCLALLAGLGAGGAASAQDMQYPMAVACRADGAIYVVDLDLPGIWKIDGDKREMVVQASKKLRTPLNRPRCIALDHDGNLLVGCTPTRNVYRIASGATLTADDVQSLAPLAQRADGTGIGMPMGIAVNKAGDIFVADAEVHWVWKLPAAGGEPVKFAEVKTPRGVCIDAEDRLYVVSGSPDQLVRISPDGKSETIVKGKTFEFPLCVALDPAGNAYVSDSYAKAIWKVGPDGKPVEFAKLDSLAKPHGVAWRGEELLVVDSQAKALLSVDSEGKIRKLETAAAGK